MSIKAKNIVWLLDIQKVTLIIFLFFVFTSYSPSYHKRQSSLTTSSNVQTDSSGHTLQKLVDSLYDNVFNYNDLLFQKEDLLNQREEMKALDKSMDDSLRKLSNNINLENICAGLNNKNLEKNIKDELRLMYKNIFLVESEKQKIKNNFDKAEIDVRRIDSTLANKENAYKKDISLITGAAAKLVGPGSLRVKNINYWYFIAPNNLYRVHIHSTKKGGQTIQDLTTSLKKERIEPLMITNGGMYTPSFGPQGLLIENFKEFGKLDTAKPDNNLNFYLQPNGVFYIDSSGLFQVTRTDEYKAKFNTMTKRPRFATQSGPMLVIQGLVNKKFRVGSKNVHIRNGVGMVSPEKVIFIISDSLVNLYDFALVFKGVFHCNNALYLDGAISSMYLNDKTLRIKNPARNGGPFGPLISVSKSTK